MVIKINWKYSLGHKDESELAILLQKLTVVRNGGLAALVIACDMALTENEFGPKKIDRNDDLTALVIWPEDESVLYNQIMLKAAIEGWVQNFEKGSDWNFCWNHTKNQFRFEKVISSKNDWKKMSDWDYITCNTANSSGHIRNDTMVAVEVWQVMITYFALCFSCFHFI